ncbi:MAG: hypothetical protein RTV72_15610 [Candidatus Thorarchaeota archaeon]
MTSHKGGFGTEEGTIGGPNIRAVMIEQNRILLKRLDNDDVWVCPGGGPLFGETTKDAVQRHISTQGNFEIVIQRLLWISENFFVFRGKEGTLDVKPGTKVHGIGFYFLVSPKEPDGKWQEDEFQVPHPRRSGVNSIFKWFKLEDLEDVNLKPDCLKELLKDIPDNPVHVVCRSV